MEGWWYEVHGRRIWSVHEGLTDVLTCSTSPKRSILNVCLFVCVFGVFVCVFAYVGNLHLCGLSLVVCIRVT